MIRFYYLAFLLLVLPLRLFAHEPDNSSYRFIENKNQWDQNIRFRTEMKSAALYLERNCFTYHLMDGKALGHLHLTPSSVLDTLTLRGHAFKVLFGNSNPDVVVSGEDAYPDYFNFYLGNDPARWSSKAYAYETVNYQNLYDGIDLKVYTYDHNLKYDFIILPNADPSRIQFRYEGLDGMRLIEGNLILYTSVGSIIEQKPYAYQTIGGKVHPVPCHYVLDGNKLSFAFPRGYNKNHKLVIDPTLIFSTYSGSRADNFGYTATFDSDGFLYSGSTAFGIGYPTTIGAYQTSFKGGVGSGIPFGVDIAITKFDTSGTKRIYSTYLGGNGDEAPHSMIVNSKDELFIFGTTGSNNFPASANAFDKTFAGGSDIILGGIGMRFRFGSDIFLSRLSNDGSTLIASTYIGGSANDGLNLSAALRYNYADEIRGEIDVDKEDNIYIVTSTMSADFPVTGGSFQPSFGGGNLDGCIVKMNDSLSTIQWSSFLGGESFDAAYSLAIDDSSNLYITGGTTSASFPITPGVIYPSQQGGRADGFIAHVSKDGQSILHATYYGTNAYDQIYFIELDNLNTVYLFGQTTFTGISNPLIYNAKFSQPNSGQFISKTTPSLDSLMWSTVFGNGSGIPNISPTAFLVDLCSKIYLSGWGGTPENFEFLNGLNRPFNMLTTLGPNSPTDFYQPLTTGHDFYLFSLDDTSSTVHYASFFGGGSSREHVDGGTSRFDRKGKIYQAMCAGCGRNSDMPVKPAFGNALLPDSNRSDNCNLGVFKMNFRLPVVVADFIAEAGCAGEAILFNNKSLTRSVTTYQWDFGDGGTSTDKDPTHVYVSGGTYQVRLVISDLGTCNLADTIVKTLYISSINDIPVGATADEYTIYKGKTTTLHALPNSGYLYNWSPSGSLDNSTSPNPVAKPDTSTTYTVTFIDPVVPECRRTASVRIVVEEIICDEPHIFIPNAFTPNGDGDNDIVFVRSKNILEMYFTIYNRWGEKVFETSDQNSGWDGKYKGMDADPGVFVYYLEVVCVDDQKFFKKGNITLIR